jgi:RNA 2',3'-cyclic 3'-phosphodiesterase
VTRAFVAVRLPEAVLDAIAGRVAGLSIPGRLATRDQWHLTLQFLGDGADIDAVTGALAGMDVAGGRVQVGGAGGFPDARHARVLWLGLVDGAPMLARVAAAVAAATGSLGHERDPRPFRPHVTLGRLRSPNDLASVIDGLGNDPVGPAWAVDAVTVYESRSTPEGARYIARAAVPLAL